MNVDGLGNGIIGRLGTLSDAGTPTRAKGQDSTGPPQQTRPAAPPAPEPTEDEAAPDADMGEGAQKGVLRLLQEGHFKGVADVRLRINFYDELSADAAAKAAQEVTAGTGDLIADVTAKAQELVSSWGLGEDAQKAASDLLTQFQAAAQAALGGSSGDGMVDMTALADALRTAFETFSTQLAALAPPPAGPVDPPTGDATEPEQTEPPTDVTSQPAVEPPAAGETAVTADVAATETASDAASEEPVAAAADTETPSVPNPDIESLRQLFADELAGLLALAADASQLPPLASQPTGNGKAYDKFVAIYNGLTGQAAPAEPPLAPDEEHVDLTV